MGIQYTIQSVNHLNRFGWCVFFNDACSRSSENLSALIKPSEEHRLLTRTRRSELKRFNVCSNTSLGCGFKHFYFHPYFGKWSKWTNILEMGWNHQVDKLCLRQVWCQFKPKASVAVRGGLMPGVPRSRGSRRQAPPVKAELLSGPGWRWTKNPCLCWKSVSEMYLGAVKRGEQLQTVVFVGSQNYWSHLGVIWSPL